MRPPALLLSVEKVTASHLGRDAYVYVRQSTPTQVVQHTERVTIAEAERLLHVSKVTIYRWLREGFVVGEQLTPDAPWRIRIDQALRDRIRPEVPDGWLNLDEAAAALGVSRQTMLHKVQRGELDAIYVNRGRRKGLRMQVKHDQAGLFDTPR